MKAYEPFKPDAQYDAFATVPSLESVLEAAEMLVILAGHTVFKALDPQQIARQTPARLVMDTRNVCDPAVWKAAGFRVVRLGNGKK